MDQMDPRYSTDHPFPDVSLEQICTGNASPICCIIELRVSLESL